LTELPFARQLPERADVELVAPDYRGLFVQELLLATTSASATLILAGL